MQGLKGGVRAETHAGGPAYFEQTAEGGVDLHAVSAGGVLHVANGGKARDDRFRQQGQGDQAQRGKHEHVAPVGENDKDRHRRDETYPAGAGIGRAAGNERNDQHRRAEDALARASGADEQGKGEGQEHYDEGAVVVGIAEERVNAPGDAGVYGGVELIGQVLHARYRLPAAVKGGYQQSDENDIEHGPKLLHVFDRARYGHSGKSAGQMENEKAQAQPAVLREYERQSDAEKEDEVHRAEPVRVYESGAAPGDSPEIIQREYRCGAGGAVKIVPQLVRDAQHEHENKAEYYMPPVGERVETVRRKAALTLSAFPAYEAESARDQIGKQPGKPVQHARAPAAQPCAVPCQQGVYRARTHAAGKARGEAGPHPPRKSGAEQARDIEKNVLNEALLYCLQDIILLCTAPAPCGRRRVCRNRSRRCASRPRRSA